jgi:hypothetical protein
VGYTHEASVTAGSICAGDDGDGFHEVHVNMIRWKAFGPCLVVAASHRGIAQDHLPLYLGFFEFVHNVRRRGKAFMRSFAGALALKLPESILSHTLMVSLEV